MSKEPTKREDLPKSEQGQPKDDKRAKRDEGEWREHVEPDVRERRERGAKGEPDPDDYNKGEYHGLTPRQIKVIEEARGDPEKGTDGIVESPNEPPGSDVTVPEAFEPPGDPFAIPKPAIEMDGPEEDFVTDEASGQAKREVGEGLGTQREPSEEEKKRRKEREEAYNEEKRVRGQQREPDPNKPPTEPQLPPMEKEDPDDLEKKEGKKKKEAEDEKQHSKRK